MDRKREKFDEILQHVNNIKEGRGEKKTYNIYLKNVNTVFENDNDPIKLILKPKSLEFIRRDMYEKGVNHQESIRCKRADIQVETSGFYVDNKFFFGMYQFRGRIEILLMIYSDGELLTYKVNDIQVSEQSTN